MGEGSASEARVARGRRRNWWLVVRLLLAALLLAVVLRRVDWHQFLIVIDDVQPLWLVAVLLIATGDRFWMAGKWRYLLRQLGTDPSMFDAVRHYYSGGLVGAATQWQLGGDIARAVALGRAVGRPGIVAASVVFEKITGLSSSALWALPAAVLLNARFHMWPERLGVVVAGAAAAALITVPLLAGSALAPRTLELLARHLPSMRLRRLAQRGAQALDECRPPRRAILVFFALTLGEQAMPVIRVALLAAALELTLPPLAILSVVPISAFLSRLPVSPEALGVREAIFVYLLGRYGLSAAGALALALSTRVMDLVAVGIGALVCAGLAHGRGSTDVSDLQEAAEEVA
ncbi:MAG TPA: lysylphosphatidylglycerol synthase transmembrane domain-containing protein [Gemmatimonadaceae bacterium]